jgi:4-diphosphocytidyl-2-C-methyl-D-erythritol kinase
VTAALVEKAPAKINLTLRVLGRRADGYHELESLVAFADLADTLTLQPGGNDALDVSGPFAGPSGSVADNLVLKAVAALRQRKGGLKAGHFLLEKNIPVAAGIGGGSADAAAALRLLARANGLALDDARLAAAALLVGADVPVCLDSRARIVRGIGNLLSPPLDMRPLPAVLVNTGTALATRDVFANFASGQSSMKYLTDVPRQLDAIFEFLAQHDNDLTQAAIACVPVIAEVLIALRALPGVRLARMSGSGATCFALFTTIGEAAAAAWLIQAAHKDWWVCSTTLGSSDEGP